ncbi:MAG: hypothetical protein ACEQSA_05330 [Weeksellaceae bacterium]
MRHIITLSFIVLIYLSTLFLKSPEVYAFEFQPTLINRFFHSQDITHDVPNRIFLSDGDIHQAAGYIYASGGDPREYNFQHPPFIKYLYGITTILTGNPYYMQIILGITLLVSTYALAFQITKSAIISFTSALLLSIDPLFISLSGDLLLDLGQAAFIVLYLESRLKMRHWLWQGFLLGVLAASKFWAAPLFFVGLLTVYQLYQTQQRGSWRKFAFKSFILHLITAGITFCIVYTQAFIIDGGKFNIVFYQLKTLKYWLNHSVTTVPGASLMLFLTGYFQSWWGDKEVIRSPIWSWLWPVMLITATASGIKTLLEKKFPVEAFIALIPLLYLVYLGLQAPFPRYFILVLPFLYIFTARIIVRKLVRYKRA